ncbi:MAG TPA: bifunctional phosphopantothenoylcysteine decarboxylase/phosphopantothenate--cysteine ligase CoaBC [Candidatus Gemmiger faecavium]|nr:bifunctional phosphopantothenoylcysteine decarboxylase/phosphopantothenate--cysteine ligase CoaBC [Candidatus Gemmiger faecavium]
MSLQGKTVVLGVTGGIAAYKIPNVAHALAKLGADVHVLMTKNATEFITPLVFETLTNNRCIVDTFDRNFQYDVAHVSLANKADLMLIAPATANVIAKLAHGLADDMLTTVTLAATCSKLVAPAMNTHMLENPITQDNLKTLEHYGFTVIPSGSGLLACGDTGSGRLPEESVLVDYVVRELACPKDMTGMKVVVSAGATCEPMDPVRYITNHSTGKMGCAVARACMLRGADVTLLCARDAGLSVPFVHTVPFVTAKDLFEAVKENIVDADALVMAAAVADYRPAVVAEDKVKKADGALSIALERTDDILAWVGANKPEKLYLCGFSMETRDLIENSTAKLHKKNLDLIVANNLKVPGAGFGVDTNVVTLISADGAEALPLQSKDAVAMRLADEIVKHRKAD